MTDGKYGAIYTTADLDLLAGYFGIDPDVFRVKLAALPTHFPKDEPLFVLRAKDMAAAQTLEQYHAICEGIGSDEKHLAGVFKAINNFHEWADNNKDQIKVPDTNWGDDL